MWKKPTIIAVVGLDEGEEAELLSYFAGHEIRRVFRAARPGEIAAELAEYIKPRA